MIKMQCPVCKKRAFDLSVLPREPVTVSLVCPNCGCTVAVRCDRDNQLNRPIVPSK